MGLQIFKRGLPILIERKFNQFHFQKSAVSGHGFPVLGMEGTGHENFFPPRQARRHEGRLGAGGSAVVHGGVGCFHARELADEGLELKDSLQGSLADFALVGGVGGGKFTAGGKEVDHRRE